MPHADNKWDRVKIEKRKRLERKDKLSKNLHAHEKYKRQKQKEIFYEEV